MKKRIALFLVMKIKKNIHFVSKNTFKKHVDILLLLGKKDKGYCVRIKNFNKLMYNHTLHLGNKHFCGNCLQAFSTEKKLKCHINDCFKQKIQMPRKR